MYFKNVLANNGVKNSLIKECSTNRIPHAQLFFGGDQSQHLPLALAFSTYLFCEKKTTDSCGKCVNCRKMFKLTHPDLHFFYPTIRVQQPKEKIAESKKCFPNFQKTILEDPYLSPQNWETKLKSSKTANIRSADLIEICKISNLKSYQGGYKVFIIWGAEKIITKSSAILLKTIEEPPPKTVFILISNDPNKLLSTIKSRLQEKKMTNIDSCILLDHFKKKYPELNEAMIKDFVRKGESNYHKTFELLINPVEDKEGFNNFVEWIRLCFLSTNKKSKYEGDFAIIKLIDHCAMMASLERAAQLSFIKATVQVFRRAFLLNYEPSLVAEPSIKHPNFSLDSFSKYVNNYNMLEIFALLSNTHYYLYRYSNSKILFLDLSFRLGKLLHKKP